MLEGAAIQAKADARAKEWEAGAPQRAEHRAQQEAEDAAYAATMPEHIEGLTEEHVSKMRKRGKGDPEWFLTKDMAKNYINQYNATDTVGRRTSAPVDPKILQALHNTAIYGTPPDTNRQMLDKMQAAGDTVDVMTGIPLGDLTMMGEAVYTGNKPMMAMSGGMLAIPGAAGVAAKRGLGKKLGDKTLEYLGGKVSDKELKQRLAQGVQDRTGKVDERLTVGEAYDRPAGYGTEDIDPIRANMIPPEVEKAALDKRKRAWLARRDASDEMEETALMGIGDILNQDSWPEDTVSIPADVMEKIEEIINNPKGTPVSNRDAIWVVYTKGDLAVQIGADRVDLVDYGQIMSMVDQDKRQIMEMARSNKVRADYHYTKAEDELVKISDPVWFDKRKAGFIEENLGYNEVPSPGKPDGYEFGFAEAGDRSPTNIPDVPTQQRLDRKMQDVMDRPNNKGKVVLTSEVTSANALLKDLINKGYYDDSPVFKDIATKLSDNPIGDTTAVANAHTVGKWGNKGEAYSGELIQGGDDAILMFPAVTQENYASTLIHEVGHTRTTNMLHVGYYAKYERVTDLSPEELVARRFFEEIDDIAVQVESKVLADAGGLQPKHSRAYRKRAVKDSPVESRRPDFGTHHDMIGIPYQYGGTNPHEFVSETLSNVKFRQLLKDTPYIHPGDQVITMWDRVAEVIANMLGLSKVEADALFASMDSIQTAMAARRGTDAVGFYPDASKYTTRLKSNKNVSKEWVEAKEHLQPFPTNPFRPSFPK